MQIGALILAAGRSRRFGSDKRKHVLADGRSMLATTLASYRQVFDSVRVVVAPGDEALQETHAIPDPLFVVAPDARLGMGHSLAAGIAGADQAWMFVGLADMPFVEVETLQRLKAAVATAGGASIVQPRYEGRPGHPVAFASSHFPALARCTGDAGARTLIRENAAHIAFCDVADPGIIEDVDTPP